MRFKTCLIHQCFTCRRQSLYSCHNMEFNTEDDSQSENPDTIYASQYWFLNLTVWYVRLLRGRGATWWKYNQLQISRLFLCAKMKILLQIVFRLLLWYAKSKLSKLRSNKLFMSTSTTRQFNLILSRHSTFFTFNFSACQVTVCLVWCQFVEPNTLSWLISELR